MLKFYQYWDQFKIILLERNLYTLNIDTIFHAAAYKHVPLIERNIIEGIKNNVYGTKLLIDFSIKYNIKKFVLISSDKAVRPTNYMGATKRVVKYYVYWEIKCKIDEILYC